MPEITIEIGKKSEFRKLVDVFYYSFRGEMPTPELVASLTKRFEQLTENNLVTYYAVKSASTIIGLGAITNYIGSSFIGYMGIIPTKRKQGIGSILFERLVKDASSINPTLELFANLGADRIYRKYGFKDQFRAFIVELSKSEGIESNVDFKESQTIPQWVYQFDKEAMGYDRSEFLNYLLRKEDSSIIYFEEKGQNCYAIKTGKLIGPMIAQTDEIALQLFDKLSSLKAIELVLPEKVMTKLEEKYEVTKKHECIKMIYGEPIKNQSDWIWSYNSFAHG